MATMYMVNVVNKLQKSEEKGHSISHFYNTNHRETNLVRMCRCTTLYMVAMATNHINATMATILAEY